MDSDDLPKRYRKFYFMIVALSYFLFIFRDNHSIGYSSITVNFLLNLADIPMQANVSLILSHDGANIFMFHKFNVDVL